MYRPNAVRSVYTTEVKILPHRPVNKMFIIWQKQEQCNSFNVTGLYEPSLILPKFASPLLFFSHQLFGTYKNKYRQMKTVNDFAFQFATFSLQNITGLDAGLDAGLDGKILTAVNIYFSQSNSRIWQFPVLAKQSHIIMINNTFKIYFRQ